MSGVATRFVGDRPVLVKELSSGKAENDFAPQQSAFQEVQALAGSLQDRQQHLDENLDNVEVAGLMSEGTEQDGRVIQSLHTTILGQLDENGRMIEGLQERVARLDDTGHEENRQLKTSEDNSADAGDPQTIVITSGAQAGAQAILLEIQEKYYESVKRYNEILQAQMVSSPGLVGALARQVTDSASMDAANQRLEKWSYIGQAGGGVVNLGMTVISMKGVSSGSKKPQDELNHLNAHDAALAEAHDSARAVRDVPPRGSSADLEMQNALRQMKVGNFTGPVNKDAYAHLVARPDEAQKVAKMLNEKITAKSEELTRVQNTWQRRESLVNSGVSVLTNGQTALIKGLEAENTQNKGVYEATRTAYQDTTEKLNQNMQSSRDAAAEAGQKGKEVLQARQAIQDANRA